MPKDSHYHVQVENLGASAAPVLITQSEFMRRYRDMSALNGGLNFYGEMPDSYTVILNYENPLIQEIIKDKDEETRKEADEIQAKLVAAEAKMKGKTPEEIATADKDEKERLDKQISELSGQRKEIMEKFGQNNTLLKQIADLALLSNNMLKGKELHSFIKRSLQILGPDGKSGKGEEIK